MAMPRLRSWDRPMIYGFRGSSRWLIDASMIIWNLVGIAALIGLIGWVRGQRMTATGTTGGGRLRSLVSGRKSRLSMPAPHGESQMAHARRVGDETSEDILQRELERSAMTPGTPSSAPHIESQMEHARRIVGDETSEAILERALEQNDLPGPAVAEAPTSEDILQAELARSRGQGDSGGREERAS